MPVGPALAGCFLALAAVALHTSHLRGARISMADAKAFVWLMPFHETCLRTRAADDRRDCDIYGAERRARRKHNWATPTWMTDLLSAAQSNSVEKIPKTTLAQVMAAQGQPAGDKHLCALCVVRAGWCHRDDGLQDWGYQGEHLHRRPCSGRIPKTHMYSALAVFV